MTPATPVTVPSGDGLVNARALDGQLRLIVAQVNALIAALGVARGQDNQLVSESLRWRMAGENLRTQIASMVEQVAAIRLSLNPAALNYTLTGKTISSFSDGAGDRIFLAQPYVGQYGTTEVPFIVGGDTNSRYRLTFRIRSMCQRTYAHPPWIAVRGTVSGSGTTVTGVSTFFTQDVIFPTIQPTYIRVNGEIRRVATRPNNTTLTITTPWTVNPPPGSVLFVDSLPQPTVSPLFAANVYSALPPGARAQHPFAFTLDPAAVSSDPLVAVPYGIPQGRDFLDVVVIKPDGTYREIGLLTFQPCATGSPSEFEQRPASRDFIFQLDVNGGDTVEFGSLNSDTAAVFYAKSDYPLDDDPRFPALYRFPAGQTGQVDLLAIAPVDDSDTSLLTEAGFPIQGEAPQSPLTE